MERNIILEISGFVFLVAGIGIIFYLYPPDLKQVLILVAVILIILGIFIGLGGVITSVSKPEKGIPIK